MYDSDSYTGNELSPKEVAESNPRIGASNSPGRRMKNRISDAASSRGE